MGDAAVGTRPCRLTESAMVPVPNSLTEGTLGNQPPPAPSPCNPAPCAQQPEGQRRPRRNTPPHLPLRRPRPVLLAAQQAAGGRQQRVRHPRLDGSGRRLGVAQRDRGEQAERLRGCRRDGDVTHVSDTSRCSAALKSVLPRGGGGLLGVAAPVQQLAISAHSPQQLPRRQRVGTCPTCKRGAGQRSHPTCSTRAGLSACRVSSALMSCSPPASTNSDLTPSLLASCKNGEMAD